MKSRINILSNSHLLTAFLVFICFQVSSQENELKDFQEIKIFNGLEVIVIPSDKNRIEISGHSKEEVEYSIIQDRLEIRMGLDNIWSDDNTVIKVYGNSIEIIDVNEGSSLEVQGVLEGQSIVLRAQEGASIYAEVNANLLKSKAVSGGSITVNGSVEKQEVEVSTGGHFFGRDLETKNTVISVSTAGRGEVFVTDYCKATASLGGIVEISGDPDKLDHKTSLGGKIF